MKLPAARLCPIFGLLLAASCVQPRGLPTSKRDASPGTGGAAGEEEGGEGGQGGANQDGPSPARDGGPPADVAAGSCGSPCPLAGKPCRAGVFDCAGGAPVCVERGNAPNGKGCGQNMVCRDGACQACTPGSACVPADLCHEGTLECTAGVPSCRDTGRALPAGASCGPNDVCTPGGACILCVAGEACSVADPCKTGKRECSTGTPVCVAAGNARNGTDCGTGKVCSEGACITCVVGMSCPPANKCHTGTLSCASGAAQCTDTGAAVDDGTPCGQNMVCRNGACSACTSNLPCTPDLCRTGKTSCASGASECVDTGMAADNSSCGMNAICKNGTCTSCGSTGEPCCNGSCPGGTCSSGRCCPSGQTWTGNGCEVVCGSTSRLCGSSCLSNSTPCNGTCPAGRINCNGTCQVGDCCSSSECGRCRKCSSFKCVNQTSSEDLNDDCYEGPCDTGNCDGNGGCGHLAANTKYCEVTRIITCSGGESFTDYQCPYNCTGCKPTKSGCTQPSYCNDCFPNFRECVGSNQVRTCGSNGKWGAPTTCTSGCQNGQCQ